MMLNDEANKDKDVKELLHFLGYIHRAMRLPKPQSTRAWRADGPPEITIYEDDSEKLLTIAQHYKDPIKTYLAIRYSTKSPLEVLSFEFLETLENDTRIQDYRQRYQITSR